MSAVDLRVDWCDHAAAKYAVEHWHYSRRMPAGKLAKLGAWEGGAFVGVVLFAWGANNHIGSPYGLEQIEVCELVRVALRSHLSPVSQIVAEAMRRLRQQSPGLRLIVSYADPAQGHVGAIYQAMNWAYVGTSKPQAAVLVGGEVMHKKSAQSRFGNLKGAEWSAVTFKHKYLYPLDRAMRRQIAPLAKPYPKRGPCGQGVEGDASGVQSEGAGSIPAARFEVI